MPNPQTIASRHPNRKPGKLEGGLSTPATAPGGAIDMVSDDEILEGYRLLASHEGIFLRASFGCVFRRGSSSYRNRG